MANSSSRPNIFIVLFACLAGLGVTILGVLQIQKALETKKWPSTDGTIITSEITGASKFTPIIRYLYYVDDQEYSSDQITPLKLGRGQKKYAEKTIAQYPLNATVKVYYNPADPNKAVLEPGLITGNFMILLIGLVIFITPMAGYIYSVKQERNKG